MHAKSVTTAAAVTSLCHDPATHLARDLTAANPVQHKNMFVLQWSLHSIIMLHCYSILRMFFKIMVFKMFLCFEKIIRTIISAGMAKSYTHQSECLVISY
jgi:hypothetical protein